MKFLLNKTFLTYISILFLAGCSTNQLSLFTSNQKMNITSPDTSLLLEVHLKDGFLSYNLKKDSKPIIDESQLGIKTDQFELFDNLNTDLVTDTTPQLGGALDAQNNNMSNVGTIDGANLQLDFGTI